MFRGYNEKTFILDMASDLNALSRILEKYNSVCPYPASKIANIIAQIKKSNSFFYELKPIEFIFSEKPAHLSHKNISNLRLWFSMKIGGEHRHITQFKDVLNCLEFNIWVVGVNENNKTSNPFYSIHFDRHIEDGNLPDEVHPIYHFQFGGRKIKEKNIDFGQALFMDTPRIMHHPMDIFLGIDFILSNFFPSTWKEIRKNGGYINLIKKYQTYFIYPYFKIISKHFEESIPQPWNSKDIYPQLIKKKY